MEDRRRHKRLPIKLHLEIDKVFKQDNIILDGINADIEVINISRTGIGFICAKEIPLGYYFNTKIELDDKEFFYTVIKIIRKEDVGEGYILYGCEFTGLANFLANKIDNYEKTLKYN